MLSGLNKVINLCKARGLEVETIHADNEFKCLRDLRHITLNVTAADQHVSMIERSIQTIKERTRRQIQFLPYTKYSRNMIVGCIVFSIKSLNNEIGMCKLSSEYSPHTLVTGQPPQTNEEMTIMSYGDYAEVYAANNIKNNNEERTISTIALCPSSNSQGGWMFISLSTGRILHRSQWKMLLINDKIIDRIEELGDREKLGFVSSNFKYKWKRINDGEYHDDESVGTNKDYNTGEEGDEPSAMSIIEFYGIADEVNEMVADEQIDDNETIDSETSHEDERSERDTSNDNDPNNEPVPDVVPSNMEMEGGNEVNNDINVPQPTIDEKIDIDDQSQTSMVPSMHGKHNVEIEDGKDQSDSNTVDTSTVNQRYNLRARKNMDYKNLHRYGEVQLMQLQKNWINRHKDPNGIKSNEVKSNDLHRRVLNTIFTQMAKDDRYAQVSVSEGIKRHGGKVIMAVLSEYAQLNDQDVRCPRQPYSWKV